MCRLTLTSGENVTHPGVEAEWQCAHHRSLVYHRGQSFRSLLVGYLHDNCRNTVVCFPGLLPEAQDCGEEKVTADFEESPNDRSRRCPKSE